MIEKTIDKYLTEAIPKYKTKPGDLRPWKVTRIWYVNAKSGPDAILNTKKILHDEVNAVLDRK